MMNITIIWYILTQVVAADDISMEIVNGEDADIAKKSMASLCPVKVERLDA